MKDVFLVIGYDSIAAFYDIYKAEKYRVANHKLRVEHHTIKDWKSFKPPPEPCAVCGPEYVANYCFRCGRKI